MNPTNAGAIIATARSRSLLPFLPAPTRPDTGSPGLVMTYLRWYE